MGDNPEQDADRAAFESFVANLDYADASLLRRYDEPEVYASLITEVAWDSYQAAKADERARNQATIGSDNTQTVYNLLDELKAMQDAFEQVCGALERIDLHETYGGAVSCSCTGNILDFSSQKRSALALAAPFRKTGV